MPELPEVESVARTLWPLVAGRKIRCVHVLHPIAVKPRKPAQIVDLAEGRTIRAVRRRGKYLLLELDAGLLVMHFRLDGRLLWFSNTREFLKSANRKPDGVHVDVALELDKGVLAFADGRHFGRVNAWAACEKWPALRQLGVDAMSDAFSQTHLADLLRGSKRPLKEFLLDQSRIAGIGNIYSAECLWHARLDPRRKARSLTRKEALRLHKAIVSVLRRALECCLHPPPNFRDPEWWFQGLERILRVYDREGKACRRCAGIVQRIQQGGRSTYCCLQCQK